MVEFVNDMVSWMMLRVYVCVIIILNIHAPTEDKIDDTKSFCEELEHAVN